ncbi:hypothetical protein FBB35_01515 [Nostoc sp. TCL240-02]|nr:hypothetical protein FBB35_01515 [Nostoc sp. TCL240-02]
MRELGSWRSRLSIYRIQPPPLCLPNKHYRSKEDFTPSKVRSLFNTALDRKARSKVLVIFVLC